MLDNSDNNNDDNYDCDGLTIEWPECESLKTENRSGKK